MKARIYNANIDVEIEGDDPQEILDEFGRDYPSRVHEQINIEWDDMEAVIEWYHRKMSGRS